MTAPEQGPLSAAEVDGFARDAAWAPTLDTLRDLFRTCAAAAARAERERAEAALATAEMMLRQANEHNVGMMEAFRRAGVDHMVDIPEGRTIGTVWVDTLVRERDIARQQLQEKEAEVERLTKPTQPRERAQEINDALNDDCVHGLRDTFGHKAAASKWNCGGCTAEVVSGFIRAAEVDAYRRAARAVCWMCDNGLRVHRGDRHLVDYTASDGEVTIQEQMCIAAPIHALIPPAGSEKE